MNFTKLLYLDVETGGLDPSKHALLSISGLIYSYNQNTNSFDNESFNYYINPPANYIIEKSALEINGLTEDFISQQETYEQVYKKLITLFDKYIDKYNKDDKFLLITYNGKFDISFLQEFFKYNKNDFLFSYISGYNLDVYELVKHIYYCYNLPLQNLRLTTVCEYFNINHNAHTSLGDVTATCKLYNILKTHYMKGF